MAVKINKFEDLACCPFCGSEEFYITNWMQGSSDVNMRFDGEEAKDNYQMYDGLIITEGKRAYCNNCEAYLGNRETGALSVGTIKRLKELGVYGSN